MKDYLTPEPGFHLSRWRRHLKQQLFSRDTHCRVCGRGLVMGQGVDMHEAIISRAKTMGLPRKKRILIHSEFNCILLCHRCHMDHPPSREQMWQEQYELYGNALIEWYESISDLFKVPLGRFYG